MKLIEIYFRKQANSELRKKLNKKLKDLPELELNTISESRKHELYTGGDVNSIIFWIAKNNMKISQ